MENLNLNLPPFYIGQKVTAITTVGGITEGVEYMVNGLKKSCCGENYIVDVGIISAQSTGLCSRCGKRIPEIAATNKNWYSHTFFAPIEERFISFADVIAKESPLIGIN